MKESEVRARKLAKFLDGQVILLAQAGQTMTGRPNISYGSLLGMLRDARDNANYVADLINYEERENNEDS